MIRSMQHGPFSQGHRCVMKGTPRHVGWGLSLHNAARAGQIRLRRAPTSVALLAAWRRRATCAKASPTWQIPPLPHSAPPPVPMGLLRACMRVRTCVCACVHRTAPKRHASGARAAPDRRPSKKRPCLGSPVDSRSPPPGPSHVCALSRRWIGSCLGLRLRRPPLEAALVGASPTNTAQRLDPLAPPPVRLRLDIRLPPPALLRLMRRTPHCASASLDPPADLTGSGQRLARRPGWPDAQAVGGTGAPAVSLLAVAGR